MKLIETPINSNVNLENSYPAITKFIFEKKAIKHYKLYALDRNQIIYADLFDKEVVVILNSKQKIRRQEVDFVIRKILQATRDHVKINIDIKEKMLQKGLIFKKPQKDIMVIEKNVLN